MIKCENDTNFLRCIFLITDSNYYEAASIVKGEVQSLMGISRRKYNNWFTLSKPVMQQLSPGNSTNKQQTCQRQQDALGR